MRHKKQGAILILVEDDSPFRPAVADTLRSFTRSPARDRIALTGLDRESPVHKAMIGRKADQEPGLGSKFEVKIRKLKLTAFEVIVEIYENTEIPVSSPLPSTL